jgi:hypothetical protein
MKIEKDIAFPHIYVLTFETRYELCMSMVRFQEFYESDSTAFRGKYFTLEQYMDYWAKKFGKGEFTYTKTWNGFNVPGSVFFEWFQMFGIEVRSREQRVLDAIDELMNKEGVQDIGEVYIIATHRQECDEDRDDIIEHEVAHALYTLYPQYRKECLSLLRGIAKNSRANAKKTLTKMGYGRPVHNDEMQAYFSTEKDPVNASLRMRKAFAEHFENFKEALRDG